MNIRKINHIGIVVRNLEESKRLYGDILGLEHLRDETMDNYGCRIAFFRCGEVMLEVIEPTGPGQSMTFLKDHGEGLHHVCYEVDDAELAFSEAKAFFLTDYAAPKPGAGGTKIFFLNPERIFGVETEFVGPGK